MVAAPGSGPDPHGTLDVGDGAVAADGGAGGGAGGSTLAGDGGSGVPHRPQNRLLGGLARPHCPHDTFMGR